MQGLTATSTDNEARIENYEILHTIGEGRFAKVKLARHIWTRTEVAIKVIQKLDLTSSEYWEPFQEIGNMKALDHPNIVKLLEVIDTDKTLCLVMEYLCGGDLCSYLKHHGYMTEEEARAPFRQVLSALQHCHQRGIVHRDLKPANLLLDAHLNVKVTDFGLSRKCKEGQKLHTFCGSPTYSAPEMFQRKSYYGPPVDVWSLGVVLYKMVTGSRPFWGLSLSDLQQKIVRGQYHIPLNLSPEIRNLIKRMIVVNPSKRSNTTELLHHVWVNMGREEPLRPACDENLGATVRITLDSRWEDMEESRRGSKSSDGSEVGDCTITASTVWNCSSTGLYSSYTESSSSSEVSTLIPEWFYDAGKVLQHKDQETSKSFTPAPSPPPTTEERTATPSPATQCGPGASSSSSSTGNRTEAQERSNCPPGVANTGSASSAGQPESVSPATPSGHRQKQKKGLAQRIWNCILTHLCCRLPSKRRSTKVKPM